MVSIKDIARECGVSAAAVSKALNDRDDIAEATKKRIRKVASEMGYAANPSARALKTNKTYNIGILFDDAMSSGIGHEYFSLILESFRAESEKLGYDITFINHNIAGQPTTFLKHCEYRSFDGVAVINADFTSKEITELAESDIPVVTLDYVYDVCSSVVSDNSKGMRKIVDYVCSMGHKKIAIIHGEMTAVTQERMSGFYWACRENKISVPGEYVREGRYHDMEMSAVKTAEFLNLKDRPTCIIYPDDYSYLGATEIFKEYGLSVPEDISVVGYDGINMARVMRLTTYSQNTEDMGRKAAELLINRIENSDSEIEHLEISGTLLYGKTVRKI